MNDPTPADYGSLRKEIEQALEQGDHSLARRLLAEVWRGDPGPARASFVLSRAERVEGGAFVGARRVALLRSFTVEPLVPLLRASAWVGGVALEVQVGAFGAWTQEILDPESALYRFEPDIAVLAVQTRDVAPDLWERFADLSAGGVEAAVDRVTEEYRALVETFRRQSGASLIIHNLELPPAPRHGVLDAQIPTGQKGAIEAINRRLLDLAAGLAGVYVLDYDGLVARHGRLAWHEPRKWLTARLPIAPSCLMHLVREWLRLLFPLTGRSCKALVLDLDNTLWGGVVGEDGVEGIELGLEYPGAAWRGLQRVALDLFHRGILLAVCSKNNEADALEAFDGHPGMLLEREHIAAWRINWTDKATNLRQIAEELNIGVDALALVDDNPAERLWVREQLPEVHVIELPADPFGYAEAVSADPVFERLDLLQEDRARGRHYVQERQRSDLAATLRSPEDFYRSLQMRIEVAPVTPHTRPRVAQLTRKTNQFNLTTHRYTEQEIEALAASPDRTVLSMRSLDRFGDNGLVGVAILHFQGETCIIDTFLLSCRVIGRTLESAFLALIADRARHAGASRLQGWFLPTKKNTPAGDFYTSHGFICVAHRDEGSCWELELDGAELHVPAWVEVEQES